MRLTDPFPIPYQGLAPTHALDWQAMAKKIVRDVLKLEPKPINAHLGAGRMATLGAPQRPSVIAAGLKKALGANVTVQLAGRGDEPVVMIGAVPGSGGSVIDAAIRAGCRVFITGEMKHHDVLGALDRGCSVILAGHTETERGYLPALASRLRDLLSGTEFRISERDISPLRATAQSRSKARCTARHIGHFGISARIAPGTIHPTRSTARRTSEPQPTRLPLQNFTDCAFIVVSSG